MSNISDLPKEMLETILFFSKNSTVKNARFLNRQFNELATKELKARINKYKENVFYTLGEQFFRVQPSFSLTPIHPVSIDSISDKSITESFQRRYNVCSLFKTEDQAIQVMNGALEYREFIPAIFKVIYLNPLSMLEFSNRKMVMKRWTGTSGDLLEDCFDACFSIASCDDLLPLEAKLIAQDKMRVIDYPGNKAILSQVTGISAIQKVV